MTRVWLNGALVDADTARLDPDERSFLLGDGAFETCHAVMGQVRLWPRHVTRLTHTLAEMAMAAPDWKALETGAQSVCRANGLDDAVVRVTVSRGAQGGGMTPALNTPPTVLITAKPRPKPPAGVTLQILDAPRRDVRNLSCRAKVTGYADMLMARREAQRAGADMAVVLSVQGDLSSADSANLFWMRDGRIFTPELATGCLPGVQRAALLAAAQEMGLSVVEGRFAPSDLFEADVVWITNAALGAVPVRAINGQPLADPRVSFGPVFALAATAI